MRGSKFLTSRRNISLSVFFRGGFKTKFFNKRKFVVRELSKGKVTFLRFSKRIMRCRLEPKRRVMISAKCLTTVSTAYDVRVRAMPKLGGVMFNNRNIFGAIIAKPKRM